MSTIQLIVFLFSILNFKQASLFSYPRKHVTILNHGHFQTIHVYKLHRIHKELKTSWCVH